MLVSCRVRIKPGSTSESTNILNPSRVRVDHMTESRLVEKSSPMALLPAQVIQAPKGTGDRGNQRHCRTRCWSLWTTEFTEAEINQRCPEMVQKRCYYWWFRNPAITTFLDVNNGRNYLRGPSLGQTPSNTLLSLNQRKELNTAQVCSIPNTLIDLDDGYSSHVALPGVQPFEKVANCRGKSFLVLGEVCYIVITLSETLYLCLYLHPCLYLCKSESKSKSESIFMLIPSQKSLDLFFR